jgi:hypothetical protein
MTQDKRYIGDRPVVTHIYVPPDPFSWKRQAASKRLKIPAQELADEPDSLAEDPEQNWEKELNVAEL